VESIAIRIRLTCSRSRSSGLRDFVFRPARAFGLALDFGFALARGFDSSFVFGFIFGMGRLVAGDGLCTDEGCESTPLFARRLPSDHREALAMTGGARTISRMRIPGAFESRRAARVGGWSLIVAAVGFMAVFSYLAAAFDYPDVLDGSGSVVLPQLLALGSTGRAVWVVYAFLPLLLIPAGVGARAVLGDAAPSVMRGALVCAVIAAVSMLLGLARWPSVHWELARAYPTATPDARVAIDAVFVGLNVYLGNFIGEFLGELALNGFFILVAVAMVSAGHRRVGWIGVAVGVIGVAAAFRNVTTAVGLIAEINNYVLPVWLIVLGIVLVRWTGVSAPTTDD
jgi:hypothetical protein